MSERDVDGFVAALKQAAATNNEALGLEAALSLLGEGLKSLARIADAAEAIAEHLPPKG